jgi:hypothetical protein
LVARQLALEWETKLNVHQKLQEDYQRFIHQQPKLLSDVERQMIRELAENIPALWNAKTTTQVQRKEIIRQVIRRIIVDIEGDSEQVKLTIEWIGNSVSKVELIRPVAKWTQLSNYPQLCQRLQQLVQAGATTEEIAQALNQEGFYPPKRRKTFNAEEVRTLMRRLELVSPRIPANQTTLKDHEWWLPQLANVLQMPTVTLYNWVRRGWVKARQQAEFPRHWIIWADEVELERLKVHRQQPPGEILRQRWQGEVPVIAIPPGSNETNLS